MITAFILAMVSALGSPPALVGGTPWTGRPFLYLNPVDYHLGESDLVLRVLPEDRYGAGPATYELWENGELVGTCLSSLTLWDAIPVGDRTFFGYCYSGGYTGSAAWDDPLIGGPPRPLTWPATCTCFPPDQAESRVSQWKAGSAFSSVKN